MEKIPAETQMVSYGGAMSLSKAKKLHMSMMGGASVSVGGIQIEVPQFVEDGIKVAKDMIKVVEWVVQFLPEFEEDLRDNVIDKPADYAPAIIEDCKELLVVLESLRPWLDSIKYILDVGKSLGGVFGSGKNGGKRLVGGDWAATFEAIKQTVETLISWYMWLKQKAATIRVVLSLQSVKKVGGDVLLSKLEPIFGAVGMGRGGRMQSPMLMIHNNEERMGGRRGKCCCDDSRMGGALPIRDVSGMSRNVGGKRGNLTKLKQLLSNPPPMPKGKYGGAQAVIPSNFTGTLGRPRKCGPGEDPWFDKCTDVSQLPGQRAAMMGSAQRPITTFKKQMETMGGRKPSARGEIVKKVMREQGLSLPQASKYVKEHGLY
jgi:hypothetical protein